MATRKTRPSRISELKRRVGSVENTKRSGDEAILNSHGW